MNANARIAAAGTAIALLTAAIPATYAINSLIHPAQARCWGFTTSDNGRLIDAAFINTYLPTYVEGVPTFVNQDARQFILDGQTYYVHSKNDLKYVTPGDEIQVAYTLENGKRIVTWMTLKEDEAVDTLLKTPENDNGIIGEKRDAR